MDSPATSSLTPRRAAIVANEKATWILRFSSKCKATKAAAIPEEEEEGAVLPPVHQRRIRRGGTFRAIFSKLAGRSTTPDEAAVDRDSPSLEEEEESAGTVEYQRLGKFSRSFHLGGKVVRAAPLRARPRVPGSSGARSPGWCRRGRPPNFSAALSDQSSAHLPCPPFFRGSDFVALVCSRIARTSAKKVSSTFRRALALDSRYGILRSDANCSALALATCARAR